MAGLALRTAKPNSDVLSAESHSPYCTPRPSKVQEKEMRMQAAAQPSPCPVERMEINKYNSLENDSTLSTLFCTKQPQ